MTDKTDDVTHRSSDPAFERLSNLKNLSLGLQVSKYLSSVRDCRSFNKNKMSESLSSLFNKGAKRVIRSLKMSQRAIPSVLSNNEHFARKTKERIPSPAWDTNTGILSPK